MKTTYETVFRLQDTDCSIKNWYIAGISRLSPHDSLAPLPPTPKEEQSPRIGEGIQVKYLQLLLFPLLRAIFEGMQKL